MKYLNKITSGLFLAVLGVLTLTGCEGGDLYSVGSPSWLNDKVDSIANSKKTTIVSVTPNPTELGTKELTQDWWSVFTDDIKIEPGTSAQVKFINYGGGSNWNNFVIILRNEAKDYEYGVFRADNWCWATGFTGEESDFFCTKKMETTERDWGAWLKSMSMAKCTATIANPGDGTATIQIAMLGADGSSYSQEYKDIINVQPDNCYFSFTVDHSYIEFGDIDIVDSEPVSMELVGMPAKVLQDSIVGKSLEDIFATLSATVTFASGATKDVTVKDLTLESIPDINSLGTKTLVAVYNKTLLDAYAEKPIVTSNSFDVVDKMYTTVGSLDNSDPFGAAHSEAIKVGRGETFVSTFTNYTNGLNWYNNFVVELFNADKTVWYATVRSDNYGWGQGYAACTPKMEEGRDFPSWIKVMNGAKVTTYVTNNGDGTADVKAVMIGTDGNTYTQEYIGINTIDPDNLYFHFTIEGAHLEFDTVVGAEDNSSLFGGAASAAVKIPVGATCVNRFTNYTNCLNWYNNFVVELFNADKTVWYATVRSDNYGWGQGYAACTPKMEEGRDFPSWIKVMNGAKVTTYVTNNGDGTADVKAVMIGTDGNTYTQEYIGINTIDPDNLYYHFTIEGAHLVFE